MKRTPFYSVQWINSNPDGIALMVRVENLKTFWEAPQPAAACLLNWCSPDGIWVLGIGYLLNPRQGPSKGGVLFLNARQAEDYDLIQRFFRQNELQIIFLDADTETSFMVEIDYGPQARAQYPQILGKMNATPTKAKLSGGPDPVFEEAKQQFLKQWPLESLLPR